MVSKDNPSNLGTGRNRHLKRITLYLIGNRTKNRQADPTVVRSRRDNQGGPSSGLLMTRLRIEGDPDHVTAVRYVLEGHLPNFPSNRRTEIRLAVEVFLGHFGEKLL